MMSTDDCDDLIITNEKGIFPWTVTNHIKSFYFFPLVQQVETLFYSMKYSFIGGSRAGRLLITGSVVQSPGRPSCVYLILYLPQISCPLRQMSETCP